MILVGMVALAAALSRPQPEPVRVQIGQYALGTPRAQIEDSLRGQNWFGYDDQILCDHDLRFRGGRLCAVIGEDLAVGEYTLEAGEYIGEVERMLGEPTTRRKHQQGVLLVYPQVDVWLADGKHVSQFRVGSCDYWP